MSKSRPPKPQSQPALAPNEAQYLRAGKTGDKGEQDPLRAKIAGDNVMQGGPIPADPAAGPFATEGVLTDVLSGNDREIFDSKP